MPSFNPSAILQTVDDKPMRTGSVEDGAKQAAIVKMLADYAKAPDDLKADLKETLQSVAQEALPALTMGRAVIQVLTGQLKGDEDLASDKKLDCWELALKVKAAERDGKTVTLSNAEAATVKERINKGFVSPGVVGQVLMAIKADAPKEVAQAAD